MQTFKAILIPMDFSAASERALQYGRDIAEVFDASLHVLHVLEHPIGPAAFMNLYGTLPAGYFESRERQARTRLEALLTDEHKAKCSAVLVTRMGHVAEEILDYLKEQPIDLVVMATTARSGVSRLIVGSVADTIVREAPCPVLTVHPDHRAQAGAGDRAA